MKHSLFIILSLVLLSLSSCFAKEIAGITLSNQQIIAGSSLELQGAGVRDKFFIDLYVAGLYTQKTYVNAVEIIQGDMPMNISLHIISSLITSEKMEEATREGFDHATHQNTQPLHDQIETLNILQNSFIHHCKTTLKVD